MVMVSVIEWVVVAFALISFIKILMVVCAPKYWLPVADVFYKNSGVLGGLFLVIAAGLFYLLVQELTIVQLVAAMAMTAFLMAFGLQHYVPELRQGARRMLTRPFGVAVWLYIIVWVAILIWALCVIF